MAQVTPFQKWLRKQPPWVRYSIRFTMWSGRTARKGFVRATTRTVSTKDGHRVKNAPKKPFMARHFHLASLFDWVGDRSHAALDRRDVQHGLITPEEFESYEKIGTPDGYPNVEVWRVETLRERADKRRIQRATRRDDEWAPVQFVVATGSRDDDAPSRPTGTVRPAGWRPPQPRPASKRPQGVPKHRAPKARPRISRKPDRPTQLRGAWGAQWNTQKEIAMADATLAAAVTAMRSFAEDIPTDRAQLHMKLASLAAFGEAVAEMSESFKAGLEQAQKDGTPGVPGEVTQHLAPIAECGSTIAGACQDTANAFEDRFAIAIQAAADEEKMSDDFLKKQPA